MRYAAPFIPLLAQRVALMVSSDKITGPARGRDALRHRFCLGGVALEVLPEPGFAWALPPETEQHISATCTAPTLAAITCSLRVDNSLMLVDAAEEHSVKWEQTPDGLRVRARHLVLDIAALGHRRYVVAARIGHASLLTVMLNTLVTSVAELAGGLCLHATAVAHARGAVLLLGPSGAGKSTAAGLLEDDVACLSNDRVTLVPDPFESGKFWVWSLPIGKAPAIAPCQDVALPLAALFRVVKANAPEVSSVREVEALMQIREAVEVGAGSEFFEPERLRAVAALASAAKSGVARVALATSWRPQLESFLMQAQPRNAGARLDEAEV
ncbi:MAG TPA: hypothetical protein VFN67_39300 [Polyangiales bacterium]|nr:hypothetical protein [Polyangiales bacterium]